MVQAGNNETESAEAHVESATHDLVVPADAQEPVVEQSTDHDSGIGEAPNAPGTDAQVEAEATPEPELTPFEAFLATRNLVFIAPDVPPVQPRQRRADVYQHEEEDERDRTSDHESGTRRRNRRRTTEPSRVDETPRQERRQAPVVNEPQKLKGSTRLEAKKQRRREGREAGRRRTVITESEFLARREAVDRVMVVRATKERTQIGVLEDNVLVEHYVARSSETSLIGNVYLGKVQNVLPSMEAAFVDIGRGRNAVLYSGEVDWSEFEGTNTARKIENALSPGDKVLVQVTKDPVGHKGARLTSQVSLPGRFLVYVPGGAMNGISRKLPDTERARLKKILKEVIPDGAGVIVRTAAEGASEEHLTLDVQRLRKQWESIQERSTKDNAPALLHSESDMLTKIVRDVFNEDFQKMIISGAETFTQIQGYLEQVAPELCERLEQYDSDKDVFDAYRISEQIVKALDRKVWLPSGGSLVIDRTEAMTVVDVNTGKFVGSGGNLEETVTKNNLEAAEEIVRQLRLRDIGGIIVVDFIDMVLESNRDLVLRRMIECLSRDRTKHQVAEVTSLGLVQMTRKKLGLGLLESFSEQCDVCAGRGLIVHHEPVHREATQRQNNKRKPASNGNQQQSVQQPHAISDGAKNMLAQVAASTISSAGETVKAASEEPPARKPRTRNRAVQQTASAPSTSSTTSNTESSPISLLDSVLSALPEAPDTGESRLRSRRASRRQQGVDAKKILNDLEEQ